MGWSVIFFLLIGRTGILPVEQASRLFYEFKLSHTSAVRSNRFSD
ncbi:MAG: hypothetical protein SXA11_01400 [Cyanobacteriota bacterium]|nr:hypothetical protein [Cyanobacteriota bacterium]